MAEDKKPRYRVTAKYANLPDFRYVFSDPKDPEKLRTVNLTGELKLKVKPSPRNTAGENIIPEATQDEMAEIFKIPGQKMIETY